MENYTISNRTLKNKLNEIFDTEINRVLQDPEVTNSIRSNKLARLHFNDKIKECETSFDHNHLPWDHILPQPFAITIGIEHILDNTKLIKDKNGKEIKDLVNDADYVEAVKGLYHEIHHIENNFEYSKKYTTGINKEKAKCAMAAMFMQEYKDFGYCLNIDEIDCELFAIKKCEEYFKDSGIDYEKYLLANANRLKFGHKTYESLEEVKKSYKELIYGNEKTVNWGGISAHGKTKYFKELLEHEKDRMAECGNTYIKLILAKKRSSEMDVLCKYIAEKHPGAFRNFNCLKEDYLKSKSIFKKKNNDISDR